MDPDHFSEAYLSRNEMVILLILEQTLLSINPGTKAIYFRRVDMGGNILYNACSIEYKCLRLPWNE